MKRLFTLLSCASLILMSDFSTGQEIAVTERGDSVILFANGSWDYYSNYLSEDYGEIPEIHMNEASFSKPNASKTKIEGSNGTYEIWYNDKVWKRVPVGDLNPDAEIALQLKNGDAYAMVIYEEIEIEVVNLSQIALDNAFNVAPDIQMTEREFRVVNNDTLVCMRMEGSTQGMKVGYYSYFLTNPKGSIQFHTFSGHKLIEKYKEEIEDLLNGLVAKD